MSGLEVSLSIVLIAAILLLISVYRKYLVVRHYLLDVSDQTNRIISEMRIISEDTIIELATWHQELRGNKLTKKQAKAWVPYVVLESEEEWSKVITSMKAGLERNGLSKLTDRDVAIALASWFK
jgi:hypothetical protein